MHKRIILNHYLTIVHAQWRLASLLLNMKHLAKLQSLENYLMPRVMKIHFICTFLCVAKRSTLEWFLPLNTGCFTRDQAWHQIHVSGTPIYSALRPRSLIKTHNSPFDLIFVEFLWRNKFGSWRRIAVDAFQKQIIRHFTFLSKELETIFSVVM